MTEKPTFIEPINWNAIEDQMDIDVWNKQTNNFWLPEKIPMANDIKSWSTMTPDEKTAVNHVFGSLTALDTVQSKVGVLSLLPDAQTPHEEAVYTAFSFFESIHAKSYSTIFSTLCSTQEINAIFRWVSENEYVQEKERIVLENYYGNDPEKKKIASVLLESFLFYSGFYLPLWWSSRGKLTNTADMIRLILRDEVLHGYFIGAKFQKSFEKSTKERQEELHTFTIDLLLELMDNEEAYTEEIYDATGQTEDVKKFLKYNANKALMNLGFDPIYSREDTEVSPAVMSALSGNANENHDFFSGSGSSYVMGIAEETDDDDWDF